MAVLVTGGAGYIGSHTCVELLNSGYKVVVVDDLSNSSEKSVERIEQITGKKVNFYNVDVADENAMTKVFADNSDIDSVIHFAGFKAVGESVAEPLKYYQNNLGTTFTLIKVMKKFSVNNFVFSSSATVYGLPETCPLDESMPTSALNPYGNTKIINEEILKDEANANKDFNVALLRYFNPVGAHSSHLIGEDPKGIPNNLMPFITQVAVGKLQQLSIFGTDYDTPDGTCVRDYIHVVDLAKGHISALKKLETKCGVVTYNLGTGIGYSVMQMVNAFISSTGVKIDYKLAPRRAGDAPECYAKTDKATAELGWKAEKTLEDMCRDHYLWQKHNPSGYDD